ncbi:MAG: hypothetical protein IKA99_01920 [Clostridia bacterium]|nr:hypothetical protein [Clostridia bacterium]
MKNNRLKFKKTLDMVFDRANEYCDKGDYVSALSSLLNEMEQRPDNAEICAHIADIYTELGLFENGVSMWFKYLLRAKENSYWEGFNGLGACFYFLENKYMAGYYFNEQLMRREEIDGVYAEILEEYLEELNALDKPKFSIVKDKTVEELDEEVLLRATSFSNEQNYDKALEILDQIGEESPLFGKSLFEKACIYLNKGEFEPSYANIKTCLDSGYKDVTAISLAIDLSSAMGLDSANEFKKILLDYKPTCDEDKYRKLTSLCDYAFFDEALKVANELLETNANDANTSYVKGFLLYNKGDYKGAEKCFKRAYLLSYSYPSLYYLKIAQSAVDGKPLYNELKIEFSVMESYSKEKTDFIKSVINGEKTLADYSDRELLELADWCFSTKDDNLQFSLGWLFIRSGDKLLQRKIKEELVNPATSDAVKQSLISIFCDSTDEAKVKVVYENFFITLKFNRPNFKEDNKETFKKAYAKAFGRLSVLNLEKIYRLSIGALELQEELISAGKIDEVKGISALATAMYFYSGLNVFANSDTAYEIFGAKKEDVIKIIKMTETTND